MKKYLKILGVSILIGGVFAYFFYKDINEEVKAIVKKEEILTLFQVGVFKSMENANKYANMYSSSYIYNDNDYYRVFIAACNNVEVCTKLENMYKAQEVEYYLKEVRVGKSLIEKINNYEKVILKSDKKAIIENINNSILNLYATYNK